MQRERSAAIICAFDLIIVSTLGYYTHRYPLKVNKFITTLSLTHRTPFILLLKFRLCRATQLIGSLTIYLDPYEYIFMNPIFMVRISLWASYKMSRPSQLLLIAMVYNFGTIIALAGGSRFNWNTFVCG
jgi:hypothetical protein